MKLSCRLRVLLLLARRSPLLASIKRRDFPRAVCTGFLIRGQALQVAVRRDGRRLVHIVIRLACVLGVSINGIPAWWLDFCADWSHLDCSIGTAHR